MSNKKDELYSSAVTLSDMEIFIFPELLYSLVLANIMSPRLWAWRDHKWFRNIEKKTPYRRIMRLKQFIIDHYEFNLDLETWGLTNQEREIERFRHFMPEETIRASNALFGYEGDKYYFDIDIRRHFGLDKYNSDIIPFWKTETLEAMDAFQYREGYTEGAGECVSLATLYAAALFVVCRIPLEDIYLMATPLHSQNFVLVREGILTNNRRIVTKNMWFNGTELTARAQRALRNERVTLVSHASGHIHCVYPEATIQPEAYQKFKTGLREYLRTEINMEILCNFLRQYRDLQFCFQLEHEYHGRKRYIELDKVFHYEHSSPFRVNDDTRDQLLSEIDEYEFYCEPIDGRILLNKMDAFFQSHTINFDDKQGMEKLIKEFDCQHNRAFEILQALGTFVFTNPRLPDENKTFTNPPSIQLHADMSREEIITAIEDARASNETADLAFYAYRDLGRTNWDPFITAAMQRNPVIIDATNGMTDEQIKEDIQNLPNESIYDSTRCAQPDEVWNYQRGDGVERAIAWAAIYKKRHENASITVNIQPEQVNIKTGEITFSLASSKGLEKELTL